MGISDGGSDVRKHPEERRKSLRMARSIWYRSVNVGGGNRRRENRKTKSLMSGPANTGPLIHPGYFTVAFSVKRTQRNTSIINLLAFLDKDVSHKTSCRRANPVFLW